MIKRLFSSGRIRAVRDGSRVRADVIIFLMRAQSRCESWIVSDIYKSASQRAFSVWERTLAGSCVASTCESRKTSSHRTGVDAEASLFRRRLSGAVWMM